MTGGGSIPRPGEVTLANNGVLFLDELPEFARRTLEGLRQPLEDGAVTISRVNGTITYPSNIMLVAAMNPCPCGYYTHPIKKCHCSKNAILKYLNRVSGPLLDRIDIHLDICPVDINSISAQVKGEPSSVIRERVNRAREIQNQRFKGTGITCNANITPELMNKYCIRDDKANKKLEFAFEKLGLSVRAYDKLLKVARTSADLEGREVITARNISEAVQYRSLDRKYWGE
jgi:magnesium chelatase family protein